MPSEAVQFLKLRVALWRKMQTDVFNPSVLSALKEFFEFSRTGVIIFAEGSLFPDGVPG